MSRSLYLETQIPYELNLIGNLSQPCIAELAAIEDSDLIDTDQPDILLLYQDTQISHNNFFCLAKFGFVLESRQQNLGINKSKQPVQAALSPRRAALIKFNHFQRKVFFSAILLSKWKMRQALPMPKSISNGTNFLSKTMVMTI